MICSIENPDRRALLFFLCVYAHMGSPSPRTTQRCRIFQVSYNTTSKLVRPVLLRPRHTSTGLAKASIVRLCNLSGINGRQKEPKIASKCSAYAQNGPAVLRTARAKLAGHIVYAAPFGRERAFPLKPDH